MNLRPFIIREEIIKNIREFFYRKNFHEAIIPVLNSSLPLEPNLYSFSTVWKTSKGNKKLYFPTSPEATLKKMIANGLDNCFGIGATFRNLEGSGKLHRPEFLMLEWYRENATYEDIMKECQALIYYIAYKNRFNKIQLERKNVEWKKISMEDLFEKYAKLDLEGFCHSGFDSESTGIPHQVRDDILKKGYNIKNATWESLFNQIFLNEIEKHLPKDPFFLIDYPAKISPLAAVRRDKPYLAQRFELYLDGIEIANGNTEKTDSSKVLSLMQKEEKYRKEKKIDVSPIDYTFIKALEKMQGKSYAGVGLGIDRLAMILGGIKDIRDLY